MRLLLVEDDPELATVLETGFREQGIQVARAASLPQGRDEAARTSFDVIVLDVMLPGGSGLDLCRELRSQGLATPILMLTARDAIDDRIRGLDVGADDYLTKPFDFGELLARVRALLRRTPVVTSPTLQVGDLSIDTASHRVRRGSEEIVLTSKEYALLEYLLANAGRVLSRTMIVEHVWDESFHGLTNIVDVYVRHLRSKVDDPFPKKLIRTIRGAGYCLTDENPA